MVTREAGKPVDIVTLESDRLDVCGPNLKPQTELEKCLSKALGGRGLAVAAKLSLPFCNVSTMCIT